MKQADCAATMTPANGQLKSMYGITFNGNQYTYKRSHYDALEDVIHNHTKDYQSKLSRLDVVDLAIDKYDQETLEGKEQGAVQ